MCFFLFNHARFISFFELLFHHTPHEIRGGGVVVPKAVANYENPQSSRCTIPAHEVLPVGSRPGAKEHQQTLALSRKQSKYISEINGIYRIGGFTLNQPHYKTTDPFARFVGGYVCRVGRKSERGIPGIWFACEGRILCLYVHCPFSMRSTHEQYVVEMRSDDELRASSCCVVYVVRGRAGGRAFGGTRCNTTNCSQVAEKTNVCQGKRSRYCMVKNGGVSWAEKMT